MLRRTLMEQQPVPHSCRHVHASRGQRAKSLHPHKKNQALTMARAAVCVPAGAAPTRWPCAASPSPMPAPQSAGGCLKTSSRPSRLWQTPCPHRGAAHAALCWPHTAHPPSAQELDAAGRAQEEGYLERPGAAAQRARPSNPRAPARRPASAQSAPPAPHPQTSATASRRRPPWRPCRA